MTALPGKNVLVKASGTAISFTGETTTTTDNKNYKIDDTTKRVWDRTATITVYEFLSTNVAEVGTNTTNITITAHGLSTSDLIVNTTRSNAARTITVVDANNFTVTAVTGQTNGDSIDFYPVTGETFTTNRLTGTITFATVDPGRGAVRVTGQSLPMTKVAEAFEFTLSIAATNGDITEFEDEFMERIQLLKDVTGDLTRYFSTSTLFFDNLNNGTIFVLEFDMDNTTTDPDFRAWVLLSTDDVDTSVNAVVQEPISFEGTTDADGRSIAVI